MLVSCNICVKKAGIKYEIPAVNGNEAKLDSEGSLVSFHDWKVWKYLFTLHFNGVSKICYWVESLTALMLSHLCPLVCSRSQRVDNLNKRTLEVLRLSSACVMFTWQWTLLDMSHVEVPWNDHSVTLTSGQHQQRDGSSLWPLNTASGHLSSTFLFWGVWALVRVGGRIQEVTADVQWEW